MRKLDISGQRFGRLVAIRPVDMGINGKSYWLCNCDCGNETVVSIGNLRSGNTKSCGCLQKENGVKRGHDSAKHGMARSHIYRVWRLMKDRCYNQNKDGYDRYGGRGITVCDEWLGENGFVNFLEWSNNNGYADGLQIDRIDNDGNYSPDNCRWVTNKVNMRNRSVNHYIDTPFGHITIAEFAEKINGDYDLVYAQVTRQKHSIEWIMDNYKDTNNYVLPPYKHRVKKERNKGNDVEETTS